MIATIAALTLKRLRRGRAMWVALGIAMLPVVVAVVIKSHLQDPLERAETIMDLYIVELLVLAVLPALFVASSIGEDIEDRTITYLWSRPLPRWHVLVGKTIALAPVAIAVTLAGWMLAVQVGTDARAPTWTLVALAGCALAVSMLAAGIATLAPRHGMALTIIYMLLFDLPIGEIPASLQALSITHNARLVAGIAAHGVHDVPDHLTPAITMAVIAGVWFTAGLVRIRRLES